MVGKVLPVGGVPDLRYNPYVWPVRAVADTAHTVRNALVAATVSFTILALWSPAADAGARVTLSVYNIEGKLVRRLVEQPQGAGIHDAVWRGRNDAGQAVASGVYFYVLRTGRSTLARKLVLLK